MRIATWVLLGLGMTVAAPPARADKYEEAGKHFTIAKESFEKRHFRVAATEFQRAFELAQDPVLLYNVGESWEKAGEGKKAVEAYRAYLKAQPTASDHGEVQKRVKTITAKHYKLASQAAPGDVPEVARAAAPPPAPPIAKLAPPPMPPPPHAPIGGTPSPPAQGGSPVAVAPPPPAELTAPPPPVEPMAPAPPPAQVAAPPVPEPPPLGFIDDHPASKMRIAAWVGVATTVAVLTAGAIFGLAAQSRADEISRRENFFDANFQPKVFDQQQQSDYKNLRNEGLLYNGLAIGFFSAAGATAIVTTVLFVVDAKKRRAADPNRMDGSPRAWRAVPVAHQNGGGLVLSGSF